MYPLFYPCDGRRACGIKLSPSVPPISTAPGAINHVLGRRSQPSTKETGTRGTDGWQRWWVVPHGVSLSRVVLRTIVGLSTQRVFGMTKVTQKDEMAGLPSPSQAIPAAFEGVWEDAAPFDMLSRRGDKVQGLARACDSRTGREAVGARASGAEGKGLVLCMRRQWVAWARQAQAVVFSCTQVLLFCIGPSA